MLNANYSTASMRPCSRFAIQNPWNLLWRRSWGLACKNSHIGRSFNDMHPPPLRRIYLLGATR